MNPTPYDIEELKRQDIRVQAWKKNNWKRTEGFEPFERAVIVIFAAAVIAFAVLMFSIIIDSKYHDDVIRFFDSVDNSINEWLKILACITNF